MYLCPAEKGFEDILFAEIVKGPFKGDRGRDV